MDLLEVWVRDILPATLFAVVGFFGDCNIQRSFEGEANRFFRHIPIFNKCKSRVFRRLLQYFCPNNICSFKMSFITSSSSIFRILAVPSLVCSLSNLSFRTLWSFWRRSIKKNCIVLKFPNWTLLTARLPLEQWKFDADEYKSFLEQVLRQLEEDGFLWIGTRVS